jgi:8-oxo-dGTP pyrophosphatase MutT (NUDIX family)
VAVVVYERGPHVEMLFIERARRLGDPWSGHTAFPGAASTPAIATSAQAAAERETREEVGLDLRATRSPRPADDLHAGVPLIASLVLSAFVYRTDRPGPLVLNHEVRSALWCRCRRWSIRRATRPVAGVCCRTPGVLVGEPERHVVWGLTYQLLEGLFERIGCRSEGRRSDPAQERVAGQKSPANA